MTTVAISCVEMNMMRREREHIIRFRFSDLGSFDDPTLPVRCVLYSTLYDILDRYLSTTVRGTGTFVCTVIRDGELIKYSVPGT